DHTHAGGGDAPLTLGAQSRQPLVSGRAQVLSAAERVNGFDQRWERHTHRVALDRGPWLSAAAEKSRVLNRISGDSMRSCPQATRSRRPPTCSASATTPSAGGWSTACCR